MNWALPSYLGGLLIISLVVPLIIICVKENSILRLGFVLSDNVGWIKGLDLSTIMKLLAGIKVWIHYTYHAIVVT